MAEYYDYHGDNSTGVLVRISISAADIVYCALDSAVFNARLWEAFNSFSSHACCIHAAEVFVIIALKNGLMPDRRQVISQTNADF